MHLKDNFFLKYFYISVFFEIFLAFPYINDVSSSSKNDLKLFQIYVHIMNNFKNFTTFL